MFPGSQYATGGRIQDRETELDMSGFLQDIGAEELPSFDSDPGDVVESTAYSDDRQAPRRMPPSPVRAPAMRRTKPQSPSFLDENFHEFLDEMGIDELPSFESDPGSMPPTASARVPHHKTGPTMRRTELDMDGFLDEMGVDELPSFGSSASGERSATKAYGTDAQRAKQTPSKRIPMSAFLESPTGAEIDFASRKAPALPETPEHLRKTLHISGLSGMTDFFEELEELERVRPHPRPEKDVETLLRETEEFLSRQSPVKKLPISPRTRALAEMFPSLHSSTKSPPSPEKPPSRATPMRSPSPRKYPSRAPPIRASTTPGMPQAASSPKRRTAGPSPRMLTGATPYSRSPSPHPSARQPVRTMPRPFVPIRREEYKPAPDDLIQFYPSVYTDYYDFLGRPEHWDQDLMTFPENYDWTASEMQKENEVKLREYAEIKRILHHVLRIIHPEAHYSNVEPPLVLLKAFVGKVQELIESENMIQNLRTTKDAKNAEIYSLGQRIQLMESNIQEASRYLQDITELWNQKKGEYLNRVQQVGQQQGRGTTSPPRAKPQRQSPRSKSPSQNLRSPQRVRFK